MSSEPDNATELVYHTKLLLARIASLEQRVTALERHNETAPAPPFYGPQIYEKTLCHDDIIKAYQDGYRQGVNPQML